jgi:hypothetical protein
MSTPVASAERGAPGMRCDRGILIVATVHSTCAGRRVAEISPWRACAAAASLTFDVFPRYAT